MTNQTQERTCASPLTCGRRSRTENIRQASPTPSITTLSQQSGHARQTCAKALNVLVDEGLLIRYPGLGYYVVGSPRKPDSPASGADRPDAP